jgi:hypothetical protein
MRKEPSHRSEMVSQLLFGEFVLMGEEKDDFVPVQCIYDGYEGWVQASQLTPVSKEQILSTNNYIGGFAEEVVVDGHRRQMPMCTPILQSANHADPLQFGNRQVVYKVADEAVWTVGEKPFDKENLHNLVLKFLDTPYLWGGKSVYGIDCSGFVQQVFKLFGVKLLRDAYLQAGQGIVVSSLAEAKLSDLVFFQNEKGRVTHVGIFLGNNVIVHASGKVRIDPIDEDGIINRESGKRTHHFHSIRRFF